MVPFFLTGRVFACDLAHCRFVAKLCMLYKIRCKPMHPLHGAFAVQYLPVRVTHDAAIAHRSTFIPLSVSLWNALVDPVFDGVGLAGFKTRSNAFLLA